MIDGSGESGLMIAGDVTSATAFAHTLTLKGDSTDVINGISGNITDGDGTVSVFISSGQWTLSGNNNFSGMGNRIYKDSCLNINSDTALGTGTWTVDTTVTIDNTSDGAVTLTNNPIFSNMGSFIFTGTRDLNLGAGNVTLTPSTTTMTINRGTLSIGGDIGQSAADKSLTKEGTGTLALSGNNTWSGTTRINGGVLLLNSANALPGGIGTSNGTGLLMLTGGVAGLANGDFTRPVGNAAGYVRFYSDGGFAAYGEDRVVNLGGESDELTWASTANFLGNARTLILGASDADKTVDFQNPVSFGNAARTIQADDGSADVDGKISGVLSSSGTSGSLVKTGSGTLELAGDNTYTGSTTVEDGRLLITGTTSDQGSVSIKSGATLGGTGSLGLASGKNLTVEAGGTLSSGITDVGTFTINGDVVMTADAVYSWKYNNGDSSLAVINGDLQLPSVATVAVTSVCGTLPTRAILMTANSLSGETDLSDWVVEPYYVVKARGKNVEIVESNPRTLIFVQ